MAEYSEKELALIKFFGFDNLIDITCPVAAITLYRMMVEKAFVENLQGLEVESLRRCFKAINESSIFRMTSEWDDMIALSDFKEGKNG